MQRALFIFRRDLRLEDNRGLAAAIKSAKEVILAFIFTPEQIENNSFRSNSCLQFMIETLEELSEEIKKKGGQLYLFYGQPDEIVQKCIENCGVSAVFANRDYTPYSIQRDKKIASICKTHQIDFRAYDDLLLHPLQETVKKGGSPYTVFTPFFNHATEWVVDPPKISEEGHFYSKPISFSKGREIYAHILPHAVKQQVGGRREGLKILSSLTQFSDYALQRDFPFEDKTTYLSAHLKFTTCSVREIYQAISKQLGFDSPLIRSLYWREFFTLIAFYFPYVFTGAFKTKYNELCWSSNEEHFKRWCEGTTGFPIVDAGMRELNATGFMHNRLRMITASFLIKDLHINWQWGEKYFAQKLIDYDPAVNNGNWQWAASTGCDAQPYFRIFNPWNQAVKFDPEAKYIKKWVPELELLPQKMIHQWHLEKHRNFIIDYPRPIVEHAKESAVALKQYANAI